MQEIREALPGLQVPGQVFMSSRDEIVSPASAVWLEGQPLLELEWLEHSDHKYYPKADKDYLLDRFESFCIQGHDPA